jgi:hypothetical protein
MHGCDSGRAGLTELWVIESFREGLRYCLAQDTFYVGTLKGVGLVYQQTVIDTYYKVGFAKLYTRKTPLTAADMLNDRVIPFFDQQEIHIRSDPDRSWYRVLRRPRSPRI